MRIILAILGILALLMESAVAQMHKAPPGGMSEKDKAAIQEKQAEQKDTDDAYQAAIKHTPDSTQKVDPWATIRPTPTPAR
jgi:hypothetical protein